MGLATIVLTFTFVELFDFHGHHGGNGYESRSCQS